MCIGVEAFNYFMPKEVLSDKGPGGGGWIHFNKHMQVVKKPTEGGAVWSDGTTFAVGDCIWAASATRRTSTCIQS